MSFATQGSISGVRANSNSMIRGTSAGGAVAASAFDIDKFNKQIDESVEKDVARLQEEVKEAKNADMESLERQYDKQLDDYSSEKNQKEMHDASYNKYKVDLDKQFNSKKSGLSSYYLGKLTDSYNSALSTLSKDLTKQIKIIADVAQKAKSFKNVKADDKQLEIAEIKDFQNQFIDNKANLENSYKEIYSNQLKTIQNNYDDYRNNVLKQLSSRKFTMFGKNTLPPHCKINVKRLYPRLTVKIRKPRISLTRAIGLKSVKVKKEIKSLSAQLDRNFRRML